MKTSDGTNAKRGRCRIAVEGASPGRAGVSKKLAARAAAYFAERASALSKTAFRDVTVVVQRDAESDAAHFAIMGVAGATDVITQRYEPIPPEPAGIYGELYVNADRAVAAAPSHRGWSPAKEFLLYVAHGMDHLSGADDKTPRERMAMRRRELGWLRGFLETEASAQ
jgi:ssRNA-specific RNase YbeY (16S rRNA maturation enzyme)